MNTQIPNKPGLLTTDQLKNQLNVSRVQVLRLRKAGMPAIVINTNEKGEVPEKGRRYRFNLEAVNAWLSARSKDEGGRND